jgi:hypothetical protein
MDRLDQVMCQIQELREHIDRNQLAPEALVSRLDFDFLNSHAGSCRNFSLRYWQASSSSMAAESIPSEQLNTSQTRAVQSLNT